MSFKVVWLSRLGYQSGVKYYDTLTDATSFVDSIKSKYLSEIVEEVQDETDRVDQEASETCRHNA